MIKLETKRLDACHVLIADDDPLSLALLSSVLEDHVQCHSVASGNEAVSFCKGFQPDLILLDINMPDIDGMSVCQTLKAQPTTESIPVIFVTATLDVETENRCWEAGAADYITKPVTTSTLIHRVSTHLQNKLRMEQLESMTLYDQLTGVSNRLYLKFEVPRITGSLIRDKKPLSLILLDIDYFKAFNDTYGHLAGDECLQQVASVLKACIQRAGDNIVRFGGEEFLVLLPDTDISGARTLAKQLVERVWQQHIVHEHGTDKRVTISAGVATCSHEALRQHGISQGIASADKKLYEAKANGKNRVAVQEAEQHEEESPTSK